MSTAYQTQYSVLHCIRKGITYATTGIGTAATVAVGTIPAGAVVDHVLVRVDTAFNDSNNDDAIDVGTSGNNDALVDSTNTDADPQTTGAYHVYRGSDVTFSSDTVIYVTCVGTADDASAGAAEVIVAYWVDNDG